MKNFKNIFFITSVVACSFSFAACGGSNADGEGKEYTSAYICPMHCEGSGSDKVGKCPECKMDYVKNKEQQSKGH